jgi:hypothetical protein
VNYAEAICDRHQLDSVFRIIYNRLAKVRTLIVTAIILAIAWASNKNMFALGILAW